MSKSSVAQFSTHQVRRFVHTEPKNSGVRVLLQLPWIAWQEKPSALAVSRQEKRTMHVVLLEQAGRANIFLPDSSRLMA
jgi:hypothetical protein